jgi:cytochrome P450
MQYLFQLVNDVPDSGDSYSMFMEHVFKPTAELQISNPDDFIKNLLLYSFLSPIRKVNVHAAEFIEGVLIHAINSGIDINSLQFGSLNRMLKLFLQGFDGVQQKRLMPGLLSMMSHYFMEKVSDDIAYLDSETKAHVVQVEGLTAFNRLMISLLCGEDNKESYEGFAAINLTSADNDVASFLNRARYAYLEDFIKFRNPALTQQEEHNLREFFQDINKSLLACNIVATLTAQDAISYTIKDSLHLQDLYQWTLNQFSTRYASVSEIINNPSMPIERALELGGDSILTNVTFASFMLFAASTDDNFVQAIAGRSGELEILFTKCSMMIRSLNDGGSTLDNVEASIGTIHSLRLELSALDPTVSQLAPRDFFKYLANLASINTPPSGQDSRLHLLSRFIKDSEEDEYNMILNSGMDINLPIELQWEQLYYNLRFVGSKFAVTKEEVFIELNRLIEVEGLYPIDKIRLFLIFNQVLYSIFGEDYDKESFRGQSNQESIIERNLTNYELFDDLAEFFEEVLKASRREIDVNNAVIILLNKAVDFARKYNPHGDVVRIKIHPVISTMLAFALGDQFRHTSEIYVAYTADSIRQIMKKPDTFDKGGGRDGGGLNVMAEVMAGGVPGAREVVTAATVPLDGSVSHVDLRDPLEEFFTGEKLKMQLERLNIRLEELFPPNLTEVTLRTSNVKALMFELIAKLISDAYSPPREELVKQVELFESLITDVATTLMRNLAIKNIDAKSLTEEPVKGTAEGFSELYRRILIMHDALEGDHEANILDIIMSHEAYNQVHGSVQATVMALLEAGSKTLANAIMQILFIASQNPDLWLSWKNNKTSDWRLIINEALRLYPSVHVTFRNVIESTTINGVTFDPGDLVIIDIMHAMSDPLYYKDPETFDPHRPDPERRYNLPWLTAAPGESKHARGCIGHPYSIAIASRFLQFFIERGFNSVRLNGEVITKVDATRQKDIEVIVSV